MSATILIIDDSEDEQRLYQRAFRDFECHFNLVMTPSAEAGFARIAETRPDMVLLDYNLPDMDGLSFMKRLTEITDTPIPIIMLTGESSVAVAVEAMKHGADDCLVKDAEGRYLRLLPGVVGRVMAAHAQRGQTLRLQQETEALLRRNRILVQNSMDGIHVMDMSGNVVEANDAFCQMLGYTREEATCLNVVDWDAQWSADELQERFKSLVGKGARFETVHRRKDGALINVEISTSGIRIEGQDFLFAASRDITERKRAEGVLKLNKTIIETAYDGFWLFDTSGYLLEVNQAYADMAGYTRAELVGMHISQLSVQSNTPELVRARIEKAIAHGPGHFETQHRHKDGHVVDFEASIACIPEANCLFSFIRDVTERKKTEAMLMQHKLVIDTSIDGFWVNDMRGNLLEANEAYARMSGYTVEELVTMHISQLEAKEQAEDVKAHLAIIEAQGYDRFETRHRHKDGREIDIEISATFMAEPPQLVVFCRDISERKRANLELQHNQSLLNEAQRLGKFGSWELDLLSGVLRWSDEMYRMFELDPARFTPSYENFLSVVHPDDRDKVNQAYTQSLQDRQSYDVVHRLLFADGRIKWVREHCTSEFDASGRSLRSVGISQDITERQEAEAALRVAAAAFETRDAIVITDASANIIRVNRALSDITGYSAAEVLGRNPGMMRSGLHDREFYAAMWQQLLQTGVWSGEVWDKRKNGQIYPKWLTITAVKNERHETTQYVGIFSDITDRKAIEERILLESKTEHKRAEMLAQQFGHLLQGSFNEIYMFDANSLYFLLTSEGAEKNLGYMDDELCQLTPLDLQPSFTRTGFEKLLAPLRSGERSSLLFETFQRRKDGTTYPVEVRLQFMEADTPVFMAVVQDVTERKLAERQLREFSAHLQTVREEEKASVAREIHDDLGGTLAALKMDAHWLARKLEAGKEDSPLLERAEAMYGLLDNAVKSMRRIVSSLRPTILDDMGLMEALKWQCAEFGKRTGIECRVVCIGDGDCEDGLDGILSINLFRIFQESLTNVARHSGASRVEVELHKDDREVILSVADNGCGLPQGHTVASTSHGIRGMRERVEQLGGKMEIDSSPGGGFSVTILIPLSAEERV